MRFQFKNDLVYDILLERICSGAYPIGMKLPPEPAFARDFQVGKVTLRSALARLEREGLIVRMRSKGTFVARQGLDRAKKMAVVVSSSLEAGSAVPYLLSLLHKSAEKRGIMLEQIDSMLCETLPQNFLRRRFEEKGFAGILLLTSNFTGEETLAKHLHELNLPVVLPHGEFDDAAHTGFGAVVVDQRQAFGETLQYILKKPFRRIVILGRSNAGMRMTRGFSPEELKTLLGDRLRALLYEPYDLDEIGRAVDDLYSDSGDMPDAFICFSDLYAIFLLSVCKKRGLRVPEDVSVVGFSGLNCDFHVPLNLTGVKYRYPEMIENALDLMVRQDEWFKPGGVYTPPVVITPYDFIEGNSVKPCADHLPEDHNLSS